MPVTPEIMELLTQLAEERNSYKRFVDEICEMFSVPEKDRLKPYVAGQIKERIRTYLTVYITRRSLVERETGAAFTPPPLPEDATKDPEK